MVYVIDGLNGVDACYHFAGMVGIRPHGLTLRQLWKMASGRQWQSRTEVLELATLVWSIGEIDSERYLYFGSLESTGAGGPVQLSPELQSQVDAEVERLRREDPTLPKFKVTR